MNGVSNTQGGLATTRRQSSFAFGRNHIQPGHFSSKGAQIAVGWVPSVERFTMFLWFISPWEAARLSLEAQRKMAFHFLGLPFGTDRQRQEDGGKAFVPGPIDPSVVAAASPAISAGPVATGRRKTVPARKAMGVIRKRVGIKERSHRKVKGKGSKRKDKSRRQ